jgi:pimeloyl-ACP methyl ester carboxylesterase
MADIQVAAEYVVAALRTMHRRADRPIQIVGFSQGGMIGRWALKFWPDTRDLVESVIGLDPSPPTLAEPPLRSYARDAASE